MMMNQLEVLRNISNKLNSYNFNRSKLAKFGSYQDLLKLLEQNVRIVNQFSIEDKQK
jgi:mannitol/fructose-specific phosphotransferase system IIA component (Ntr-type)